MTTAYRCDRCGAMMSFEDDKIVCLRLGGEPVQDLNTNKLMDICPECWPSVDEFVAGGTTKLSLKQLDVEQAQDLLKKEGYIFYKKPEVWGQKRPKNK